MKPIAGSMLLWIAVAWPAGAQGSSDEEASRQLLRALELVGMPDVAELKFVRYNTGGYGVAGEGYDHFEFSLRTAFLVQESEESVVLLEGLEPETHERRRALPDQWWRYKDQVPPGTPLPGEYEELEFDQHCKEFLAEGRKDLARSLRASSGYLAPAHHAPLLAYWACQRDRGAIAVELVQLTRECVFEPSVERFLADRIATELRARTMGKASLGAPREALVARWQKILDLPEHRFTAEARELVRSY